MFDAFIINVLTVFALIDRFEIREFYSAFKTQLLQRFIHVPMNDMFYSLISARILKQKKNFIVDVKNL